MLYAAKSARSLSNEQIKGTWGSLIACLGRFAESRPLYVFSAVMLASRPLGRRLGGVVRVVASLSLGRIRSRRRTFSMAQGAHDVRV